jgi:hypothetical protein
MTKKTIEQIDAGLARWQTRLKRAVNAIERLQKQRKRMAKAASKPPVAATPPVKSPVDDLAIPDFLKREPDPVAEQIRQEQAETKRAKARGRIEKMKAKQRGDLKKMPLTGRAALEAIRNA